MLSSPGEPLDRETRLFMEPRFGHDFGAIRVHTGARASESARSLNAVAYAVGGDVVFATGRYAPTTAAGRRLLTHELAHTVQQSGLASQQHAPVALVGGQFDAAEREADTAANAVANGAPFAVNDHPRHIALQTEGGAQDFADQRAPEGSPANLPLDEPLGARACVLKEQIPIITTPRAVFDDIVFMQTAVDIEWRPPASEKEPIHALSYCGCSCGEYRQYVKGHIFRNGTRFDMGLCDGAKLEETVWHEDGDAATGLCLGHRDRGASKASKNDVFDQPNREWGCHYHGKDEPRVPGKPGDMIDVDLKFKGQTYDKCHDKFGSIHEWAFTYMGPLG